jgi:hypothetical protein
MGRERRFSFHETTVTSSTGAADFWLSLRIGSQPKQKCRLFAGGATMQNWRCSACRNA